MANCLLILELFYNNENILTRRFYVGGNDKEIRRMNTISIKEQEQGLLLESREERELYETDRMY